MTDYSNMTTDCSNMTTEIINGTTEIVNGTTEIVNITSEIEDKQAKISAMTSEIRGMEAKILDIKRKIGDTTHPIGYEELMEFVEARTYEEVMRDAPGAGLRIESMDEDPRFYLLVPDSLVYKVQYSVLGNSRGRDAGICVNKKTNKCAGMMFPIPSIY